MSLIPDRVTVASRGSALARAQSELVSNLLRAHHPGLEVTVTTITTRGDRDRRPFSSIGGKALFTHEVEREVAAAGVGVDPATVADEVDVVLEQVLAMSGVERPDRPPLAGVRGRTGRDGLHTEALSLMLAEMQVVARAHPMGRW